jgi:hypothetical protein
VPRLSVWKDGAHSNDYKYFDRNISELFTVGGTGILVHKYLGTTEQNLTKTTSAAQPTAGTTLNFTSTADINPGMFVTATGVTTGTTVVTKTANTVTLSANTTSSISSGASVKFYTDAAKPSYINQSALNIQDLLFVENRDRKYDTDIYMMRGIYTVQDVTFDLSQFGMFLNTGTLFMVFHINDMIATIGRKLMPGDVLELMHLKDYNPLDDSLPVALKRYFVISDCNNAAEGFSATWWPHLWRCKLNPLTDSQEYKDILNQIKVDSDPLSGNTGNVTLGSVSSIISKYIEINDSILREAENNVPFSGYDVDHIYIKPTTEDGAYPGDPIGVTADNSTITTDNNNIETDSSIASPSSTVEGYLTGDGRAPNGLPVYSGIAFPTNPLVGEYALRTDYLPNRLFRWDGRRWVKIEDNVRTTLTPGPNNQTLRSSFVNNTNTFTNNSGEVSERQSLSQALKPQADN